MNQQTHTFMLNVIIDSFKLQCTNLEQIHWLVTRKQFLKALLFLVKLHYSTGSFGGDSMLPFHSKKNFLSGTHKYSFAQCGILCTGQSVEKKRQFIDFRIIHNDIISCFICLVLTFKI
jgi:hypothetical protein